MRKVLVVGGAVIDIFAQPKEKFILRDSNPGHLKRSLGGVGRNIAENLARLGVDTTLITALGKDEGKKLIMQNAQDVMLKLSAIPINQTPTYVSILDENNDTVAAVADMDEIELVCKEDIKKRDVIFQNTDYIVIDTNLQEDVLSYIFKTYAEKIFYADVISCQKADRIKPFYRYLRGIKLNLLEAKYLSNLDSEDPEVIAKFFISQGVDEVYLTLGKEGALFMDKNQTIHVGANRVDVANTAGAGDAFLAGVIYAKVNDLDALVYAQRAAELTLKSEKAVSDDMNVSNLEERE